MKRSIFHLSHTDISRDSRILKELDVIKEKFHNYNIFIIGIKRKSSFNNIRLNLKGVKDLSVSLVTKKTFFFLPRAIIHLLNYIELFIKCLFKILNKKISIIHCHDHKVLPIGYIIKILFNCKLVYDAHELECLDKINQVKFSQRSKIVFFIEKLIWKKIDLFITVSPSILNWYKKKIGKKKNSVIILNSPKLNFPKKNKKISLREELKIPASDLIFLYVGGFQHGRGIFKMLDVFSKTIVKSNLVFVGYGELENHIMKYSKKYKNIHLLKPVPHDILVKYISSANVGLCLIEKVSLSDYFCLPNKFFEFAFANLYLISSNFPDMKKLVKNYNLGTSINFSSKELMSKIRYIENNKKELKLNKKDLTELTWEKQSKILIKYYNYIL